MDHRLQILRQARAGSLERAWTLFEASPLALAVDDPAALTLKARLVKDRAKLASGAERMRLFAESGALYERAAAITPSSYALINAASLALLAGRIDRSAQLARDVLTLLDEHPDEAETPYWRGATRAEALLLLQDEAGARAALRNAIQLVPRAWEDHAATIGQFALVCQELGIDSGWLDAVRPPRSVQFTGIIGGDFDDPRVATNVREWLERENVGFGFGALAAGADIVIAEALVEQGAELHAVLPGPTEMFRAGSVAPMGGDWGTRFDRLLVNAVRVEELAVPHALTRASIRLGNAVALGMARQNARVLQSGALILRVGEETPLTGLAAATPDMRKGQIAASRIDDPAVPDLPGPDEAQWIVQPVGSAQVELADAGEFSDGFAGWSKQGACLDCFATADAAERETVSGRLDALATCVRSGQVLATREAAFAALAADGSRRIELLGDIRGRSGSFPFYAIR